MSTIVYENAVQVAKSLLEAVRSIEEREAQSRAAAAKLSAVESAAREAESRRQAAHADCAAVNARLIEARRELEQVQKGHDEVYAAKVEAQGKLNVIRTQMAELRQNLGA